MPEIQDFDIFVQEMSSDIWLIMFVTVLQEIDRIVTCGLKSSQQKDGRIDDLRRVGLIYCFITLRVLSTKKLF